MRRCVERGRLVYYRTRPNTGFWDDHWQKSLAAGNIYRASDEGKLGWLERPFANYMPRHGRILEAGCGLGQIVRALQVRGYTCEGVEWGEETVDRVKSLRPELPIRVGNVAQLSVAAGHYAGYISLGVIEHRYEGPEPFLAEAHRVLSAGGTAFFSVPFIHSFRRFKAQLGLYDKDSGGLEFYQYAFSREEMEMLLEEAGFEVVDVWLYDSYKGLKDEMKLLRSLVRHARIQRRLKRRFRSWSWLEQHFGHMALFICRK